MVPTRVLVCPRLVATTQFHTAMVFYFFLKTRYNSQGMMARWCSSFWALDRFKPNGVQLKLVKALCQ